MRNGTLLLAALVVMAATSSLLPTAAWADEPAAVLEETNPYAPPALEQPKPGPNLWVEFIAPTHAGIRRFHASNGETFKVSRFAQVLTLGFEYSTGMLSLAVRNSVLDSSRFEVGASHTFAETVAVFTSPGISLTLRPVEMLAIELDAHYSYSLQVQDFPDGLQHHAFMGGLHVFAEPLRRFVGTSPRLRVGAGIKGGVSMVDAGSYANVPDSDSAAAFQVGVTAGFIFPVTRVVSAHIGGGYYAGFDAHEGFGFGGHNIEWNFGLRWFPFGHTI